MSYSRANDYRPSNSTLGALPARVLVFLTAIATRAPIRAAMYEAGFRIEDHLEGWRLLTATGTIRGSWVHPDACDRACSAITEIHQWVTSNFRRLRFALERLQPEYAGLFPEVDSRYPGESLLALATLLEHLSRAVPDDADESLESHARLLATLTQRGLDAAEVRRLTQLAADAKSVQTSDVTTEGQTDDRTAELVALYHWYRDWAESAKRFVKRKDYRVQMGFGKSREGD